MTTRFPTKRRWAHELPRDSMHEGGRNAIQNTFPYSKNQEQERARLYANLVRNIPVGLSVWRLENVNDVRSFTLVLSNLAARKASATRLEKFYGKSIAESFPWLLNTEIPEFFRRVVLTGEARDLGEIRYAGANGPGGIFSAKVFPLPNRHVGVVFENISDRKETEETIVNQARLLDLANDAILVRDLDGRITYWNKGAERMYGWTSKEALGETTDLLLRTEFPKPLEQIKEILIRDGHWEGELLHTRRDGTRILVASRWTLERDNNGMPVRWLQLNSDITENRRAKNVMQEAEELTRRTSGITLLSQMGSLLQTCFTAEEAYSVIAQFGRKLFPSESGVLYVLSSSRRVVEGVAFWGDPPAREQVFAPHDCWALRSGRIHVVEDPGSAAACRHLSEPQASFYLCVPMVAPGDALGVLHILGKAHRQPEGSRERLPTSKQQLAITVAEQIGLGLANLRLRDSLHTQSVRDPLTGLFNRRYMEESLERELRRAERKQGSLGLILLDIDHFKRYNDTLGHQAGDSLLRALGNFLQAHIRGEDIACRYGGDEFVVLLPDASLEIGKQRAEQIREGIKTLSVGYDHQSLGTVTLSLGVALYPEHGGGTQAPLPLAVKALYEAKRQGRDRVVVWKTETTYDPTLRTVHS